MFTDGNKYKSVLYSFKHKVSLSVEKIQIFVLVSARVSVQQALITV